jgi:predicted SAM-dependent methyltransferase
MKSKINSKIKLDLGCGTNCKNGFTGVDIVSTLKPNIRQDLNKIPYPFKDNSIDYIYTSQTLEHLSIPCDIFLKECYRILKPDGKLELITPNMFNWRFRFQFLIGRGTKNLEYNPFHNKFLSPQYIEDMLWHIGFSPKHQGRLSWYPNLNRNIHILARKRR